MFSTEVFSTTESNHDILTSFKGLKDWPNQENSQNIWHLLRKQNKLKAFSPYEFSTTDSGIFTVTPGPLKLLECRRSETLMSPKLFY